MKYKAIIFDLWGTLAYTDPHIGAAIEKINQILKENKHKEHFAKKRSKWYFTNDSEEVFFTDLAKETNKEHLKEEMLNLWNDMILHAECFPETKEVLKELKKKNLKLALVSNTTPIGKKQVKQLGIEKYFDCIVYSFETGLRKPEKEIFEKALNCLKVQAIECLVIGDQINTDGKGAESIGAEFILIDRKDEQEYTPKISSLKEIKNLL